jgi:hypothetical protein
MLFRSIAGAVMVIASVATSAAAQTVLTFDDIPSNECNSTTGNVGLYGGVDFQGKWTCFDNDQSPYNPQSGTNRIFASDGERNTVSSEFTFASRRFLGAWFAGESSTSVFFELFNGATLLHTSGSLFVSAVPAFLASGFGANVNRVRVVGSDVLWVMDDVTFGATTVIPEPSTVVLLGIGLGALGLARRHTRRRD